jgi:hypothetical protein
MLTKINPKNIAHVILLSLMVSFFGYVGYMDLVHDPAASATAKIQTKIAAQAKPSDGTSPKVDYGLKRAEIALTEYRKNIVETPKGCNCGPEIDKYTEGYHAQWCTMFASWVANEAGSPLYNEKTKSWRLINSRDFAANLEKNGTWYTSEEVLEKGLQPKIGDFVVFWRGDFEDNLGHVDVVVDLSDKPGFAGLVGGNLDGRVQYRDFSYLQYYGFLGFGRPEKALN